MKRIHTFYLSLMAIVLLSACNKAEATLPKETAVTPAQHRDALEIKITPELAERIKIGPTPSRVMAKSYAVAGRVAADETREARVGSPITGRVTELLVREGAMVKKGQILATLNSTELTNLQLSFLKATSQAALSRRAVERAQQLLDAGVIGSAELQRRQAELAQSTAEIATLRGQLKVLGMPEQEADRLEETRAVNPASHIVASIDGIVLERKATVGQVVQPADTIFLLADLSNVWMVADVPEQIAGNLTEGQLVQAQVASLSGSVVNGRLTHVHSTLDPQTRTVQVHMDVDNSRGRLKPGMLANMTLREGGSPKRVVSQTAIVRDANREYVFVQTGADVFTLREVTLGDEFEGVRVVESGLQANDVVVLDGAFHLNNERKRLALQKGTE